MRSRAGKEKIMSKMMDFKAMYALAEKYSDSDIDEQDKNTQKDFKTALDTLCEKKVPWAFQKRGYCKYCGTEIYPNDWYGAERDLKTFYEMTGDAFAANSLGYIYYYGRTNNKKPQYKKAFQYFSVGHIAGGIYESTYKLGDMFRAGKGVAADIRTAIRLYLTVYSDTQEQYKNGHYDCKHADICLRIGSCFLYGDGLMKDVDEAYKYLCEAEEAIYKRMEVCNSYGDQTVLEKIQDALREARSE